MGTDSPCRTSIVGAPMPLDPHDVADLVRLKGALAHAKHLLATGLSGGVTSPWSRWTGS